jgi:serine/threonine protein kinase
MLYWPYLSIVCRYVHDCGYVHLDVKPDNIVVCRAFKELRLIDFGSCLTLEQLAEQRSRRSSSEFLVPRYYRAPELVLRNGDWTAALDLWAAGVTLAELAS